MITFAINWWEWLLFGLGMLFVLLVLVPGWLAGLRAARALRREPADTPVNLGEEGEQQVAGVSVIVLADSAEHLDEYLESVLSQDYPAFEVIVVACHTQKDNERLTGKYAPLSARYDDRLKVCFYPPQSRALSRRKLAITIGMKAAKEEFVLVTDADSKAPGNQWLAQMMAPVNADKYIDVVLGCSVPLYDCIGKAHRPYTRLNTMLTDAQWIARAAKGRPYRGDGTNLLYRRSIFFDHKGFGTLQQLENGDDDLFVGMIAKEGNTALMVSEPARLLYSSGDHTRKALMTRREQHWFTHQFLPQGPFLMAGLASLCRWMAVICAVVCAVTLWPNLLGLIAGAVILLSLWCTDFFVWRKVSAAFGDRRSAWISPFLLIWRPLGNLFFKQRCERHLDNNYTLRH